MNRQEIEKTDLGIELSRLSNASRSATINKYKSQIEETLNVEIVDYAFTQLKEIPVEWFYMSAVDSFRNMGYIIVFKPKNA